MCQRKGDTVAIEDVHVKLIVSKLNRYLNELYPGLHPIIEYMSDLSSKPYINGIVDFNLEFKIKYGTLTPESLRFMQDHPNYYDLVIAQTCPFMHLDYSIISEIVKHNGHLALTAINSTTPIMTMDKMMEMQRMDNLKDIFTYFKLAQSPVPNNTFFFVKKASRT